MVCMLCFDKGYGWIIAGMILGIIFAASAKISMNLDFSQVRYNETQDIIGKVVEVSQTKTGKQALLLKNDMLEGKLTLPALYVLNSTQDKPAQEIAVKVKNGTATADEIARLIEFTKEHGGIEYATKVMVDFKEKALSLLAAMEDTDVKRALISYLDYVIEREK